MGIFKKLGGKLKRVISIKNLINVGTGQFGAVAKDAIRVATSKDPIKGQFVTGEDTTFLKPNYQIPAPAMDVIEGQGKVFGDKVAQVVSSNQAVQNGSSFFTKVYLQSMYQKYKTWITVVVFAIISFILYKVLSKSNPRQRGKYRR